MVSHLFYYQLALLALIWLFVMWKRNKRLLSSDGSLCALHHLLTLHWVRVVRSGLTSGAGANTAACA